MADRMAGEIFIGGNVSRSVLPDLFRAVSAQFVTLQWGDAQFCPETAEDLLDNPTFRRSPVEIRRICCGVTTAASVMIVADACVTASV